MLILISPSKSLDFSNNNKTEINSKAKFTYQSEELINILKQLSTEDISKLMKISPKLSQLNYERYQVWQLPFSTANAKQALLAFTGEVYTGIDVESFSEEDFNQAQDCLRILSGLYGLLKPLDLIQAYRLEMGIKLENDKGNTLYHFWKNTISEEINNTLENSNKEYIVNLASNEYFKAVDTKQMSKPIITPIFKDYKNGEYKIISFYAKKARGLMCKYIIQNKINTIEDLKLFHEEGYLYNDKLSTGMNICFTRDKKGL